MNNEYLKRLLIITKAIDAPPEEPSERAKELFEAALARRKSFHVVTEDQMKVIILQLLSKGMSDGAQIIEKLSERKVKLELQGEGVIYALLATMEEDRLIIGKFDDVMVRKEYKIETAGTSLLQQSAASVQTINPSIQALFAT